MRLKIFVRFGECLTLHFFIDLVWMLSESFFLYFKIHMLERRTKFLAVAVYCMIAITESIRLVLGNFACVYKKIPELAGFLIVSTLMQFPLITFFLFHQNLLNTPVETTLHTVMWLLTTTEIVICIFALKNTFRMAKTMFYNKSQQRQIVKEI